MAAGDGSILHTVRHGRQAAPAEYVGPGRCDALSVQFSPHLPDYFLAAYSNGTVMLYHQENPIAIRSWGGFSQHQIIAAFWMPSQPQIFLVYNTQGQTFVFNLLKDVNFPVSVAIRIRVRVSGLGVISLHSHQIGIGDYRN